ncbi:toxin-antitoxin system protein [Haemophilus paracuniculus]|uniref:Toxin-antitoxin system protein n=1 Tax=Haemophilus paracuniculus TaxID=734 RepID=A0A1T0AVH8_9PAST|nr:DUF1778 domain-containing protein [Haemophilus paracuniculus]OOS00801.1 toxin-antitoxin system protein [Haemophilus paracuniculus]
MRTAPINLRAKPSQRDLIDHASALLGKTRSEFMLEVACHYAQDVILDRQIFQLSSPAFQQFSEMLEQPLASAKGLEKLMAVQSPWES